MFQGNDWKAEQKWFLLPKIRECRAKMDPEKAISSLSLRCVLDV